MAKAIAAIAVAVGVQFLSALLLMLTIGVVHAGWLAGLPTIGYWTAVLICLLLAAMSVVRAAALAGIKELNKDDKPTKPTKPASNGWSSGSTGSTGSTVRMHWVDPESLRNRGLL